MGGGIIAGRIKVLDQRIEVGDVDIFVAVGVSRLCLKRAQRDIGGIVHEQIERTVSQVISVHGGKRTRHVARRKDDRRIDDLTGQGPHVWSKTGVGQDIERAIERSRGANIQLVMATISWARAGNFDFQRPTGSLSVIARQQQDPRAIAGGNVPPLLSTSPPIIPSQLIVPWAPTTVPPANVTRLLISSVPSPVLVNVLPIRLKALLKVSVAPDVMSAVTLLFN